MQENERGISVPDHLSKKAKTTANLLNARSATPLHTKIAIGDGKAIHKLMKFLKIDCQ